MLLRTPSRRSSSSTCTSHSCVLLPSFGSLATHFPASSSVQWAGAGTACPFSRADAGGCARRANGTSWVTPAENGWLFPPRDPQALAQAIVQAVEQRDRLPEMGRSARRLAEKRADWKQNFPWLFEAYRIARTAGMQRRKKKIVLV